MLNKPPHGAPCNGCGGCCVAQRCPLGELVFGAGDRCPALETRLPGFACGLVEHPERYAPKVVARHGETRAAEAAAILIGAGLGCDAVVEGEAVNETWRAWAIQSLDREAGASAAMVWRPADIDRRHAKPARRINLK